MDFLLVFAFVLFLCACLFKGVLWLEHREPSKRVTPLSEEQLEKWIDAFDEVLDPYSCTIEDVDAHIFEALKAADDKVRAKSLSDWDKNPAAKAKAFRGLPGGNGDLTGRYPVAGDAHHKAKNWDAEKQAFKDGTQIERGPIDEATLYSKMAKASERPQPQRPSPMKAQRY